MWRFFDNFPGFYEVLTGQMGVFGFWGIKRGYFKVFILIEGGGFFLDKIRRVYGEVRRNSRLLSGAAARTGDLRKKGKTNCSENRR